MMTKKYCVIRFKCGDIMIVILDAKEFSKTFIKNYKQNKIDFDREIKGLIKC